MEWKHNYEYYIWFKNIVVLLRLLNADQKANWRRRGLLVMCWSGGNQLTDAAFSLVGFSRGLFWCGPSGAWDVLLFWGEWVRLWWTFLCSCLPTSKIYHPPYLFTAKLTHITVHCAHNSLPRLSSLYLSLSLSSPSLPSSSVCLCLHTQTGPVLVDVCSFWLIKIFSRRFYYFHKNSLTGAGS